MDPERHYRLTGVRNDLILSNLRLLLENRKTVKVRVPLLKGINDGREDIERLAHFLRPWQKHKYFKGIDLLPYHKLGVNKYSQLDMPYSVEGDPALSEADLDQVEEIVSRQGFPVAVIRH
jgi:pyruvate formate lyase activating enzyme